MNDGLKYWQQWLQRAEFFVEDEDEWIFQLDRHFLRVRYEVWAEVAAVEVHAFYHFHFKLEAFGFFDGDDAFATHFFHCFSNFFADFNVAIRRNRTHLGDFRLALDRLAARFNIVDYRFHCEVDAAFQIHWVEASSNGFCAFGEDRLGKHGSGGGAIASQIVGFRGHFLNHLRAHVLELVREGDFFRHGHAIFSDAWAAVGFFNHYVAAFRPESYFNSVGQNGCAFEDFVTRISAEAQFFRSHGSLQFQMLM